MEHSQTLFAFILIASAFTRGLSTRCEAPPVFEGETAEIVCIFDVDVKQSKKDFLVQKEPRELVLNCEWLINGRPSCMSSRGYFYDGEVSNRLTLKILHASKAHVGTYICQMIPDTTLSACTFTLKARNLSSYIVETHQPETSTPVFGSSPFLLTSLTTQRGFVTEKPLQGQPDDRPLNVYNFSHKDHYFIILIILVCLLLVVILFKTKARNLLAMFSRRNRRDGDGNALNTTTDILLQNVSDGDMVRPVIPDGQFAVNIEHENDDDQQRDAGSGRRLPGASQNTATVSGVTVSQSEPATPGAEAVSIGRRPYEEPGETTPMLGEDSVEARQTEPSPREGFSDSHQQNPDSHQQNPDSHQQNPDSHQQNPDSTVDTDSPDNSRSLSLPSAQPRTSARSAPAPRTSAADHMSSPGYRAPENGTRTHRENSEQTHGRSPKGEATRASKEQPAPIMPSPPQNVMSEIESRLVTMALTESARQAALGKISTDRCSSGDVVMFVLVEKTRQYVLLTSRTDGPFFLHQDSFKSLGVNPAKDRSASPSLMAEITEREYCQAHKFPNRFRLAEGTKFYRLKAKPWAPTD